MSFITKYPLSIADDGRIETRTDPGAQFDLFLDVRPGEHLFDPEYGLGGEDVLQTSNIGTQTAGQVYALLLREKLIEYFTDITIRNLELTFDEDAREIEFTVEYLKEGDTKRFSWNAA